MVRAFFISNGTQAWYKAPLSELPECPAQLTMNPCNSYPAAACRSKHEMECNEVGHLAGVQPLAVVVTPGSFMGQRQLGDSIGDQR